MLNHLLVPLDRAAAESAVWQLGEFLSLPDADVTLVHALEPPPGARLDPGPEGRLTDRDREAVEDLAKRLRERGALCATVVKEGRAAELILSVAGEDPDGLIAMSTTGDGADSGVMFGSVTNSVLRSSRVPVLIFREPAGALRLRKILLTVDGSENSLVALPCVRSLAKSFGAGVIVLGIVEAASTGNGARGLLVERARRELAASGIGVDPVYRNGDPASEILEACSRHQVDLLAMSTHGRAGLSRWVMGRVTEKVLRSSTVPVLVVRGRTRD